VRVVQTRGTKADNLQVCGLWTEASILREQHSGIPASYNAQVNHSYSARVGSRSRLHIHVLLFTVRAGNPCSISASPDDVSLTWKTQELKENLKI